MRTFFACWMAIGLVGLGTGCDSSSSSGVVEAQSNPCAGLPSHADLQAALDAVVDAGGNSGLANEMWVTTVNRSGEVCAVAYSGEENDDQWPGSRVISAQKANTANAFSLPQGSGGIPGLPLSTANLFSAVQPGGSLFGLQFSNPVDTGVAYSGNSDRFGEANDPMGGERIGGVNVFGGGLALYNEAGELIGALGVSGDTSCTDHVVAWKVRHALNLDNVVAGVSATGDDNIIFDITDGVSAGGFGHPVCDAAVQAIAENLPMTHPIGPMP